VEGRKDGGIVVGETPMELFRDLVTGALAHRRLRVQEVTEFYLVQLMARFLERDELFAGTADGEGMEPLAMLLLRALGESRQRRWEGLRMLGDTSLFLSGFFPDWVARSAMAPSYYVAMGERAYGTLATSKGPAGSAELFGEMSDHFEELVEVLAEIAEMQDLRSNRGLVRLYERFLHTGSERVAEQLRARGVALFAGPGARNMRN
jgi:hypothetical protein